MDNTKEFLKELTITPSVSGSETRVGEIVAKEFEKYCDEVKTDSLGNVIALKKGKGKGKILFSAHMDEIGLMITEFAGNGFLHFISVGGYDQRALVSQEVIVHGKEDIFGVIGVKPPHLTSPKEAGKAHKMVDMTIDTGINDEKLRKLVKIGDVVTVKRDFVELQNGLVAAKSLDDKAGVAMLLECMKNLDKYETDMDVYYVGSIQEEIGAIGAQVAAYGVKPDIAIAIDVCHGKTPDVSEIRGKKIGGGTVVTVGPAISPRVYELLLESAKNNFLSYQIDVAPNRTYTDADNMQIIDTGVATGVLSIPLKYMHTSVETIDMKDVYHGGKLLANLVKEVSFKDLEELLCL